MNSPLTLKEIGVEMNSQDNRATQCPLFVVQNKVKRWVDSHDSYDDIEEIDSGDTVYFKWEWEFDLRAGAFLTAKACEQHIKENAHHYHEKARSYAVSAWRNEEMKSVMQSLSSLASPDSKIPSHYE